LKNLLVFDSGFGGGSKLVVHDYLKAHYDKFTIIHSGFGDRFFHCNMLKLYYRNVSARQLYAQITIVIAYINVLFFLLIRREKYNVVVINSSVNIFGLILLKYLSYNSAYLYVHETPNLKVKFLPDLALQYLKTYKSNQKHNFIFVHHESKVTWEKVLGFSLQSCIIMPPRLEARLNVAISPRCKRIVNIGYIGALVREKNVDSLITAVASIAAVAECKLIIAGSGNMDKALRLRCQEAGINFEFLGYLTDTSIFYKQIDILVQPSFSESWGLTILEGLRYGKVVIASEVTPLVHYLKNEVDCLFFNPLNSSSLFRCLNKCISDVHFDYMLRLRGYERYAILYNELCKLDLYELIGTD
jgi:glycosyltransferase involved in cell wall biosynthesis